MMPPIQKLWTCITNYHPLDPAGDALWLPTPDSCSTVGILDLSYDIGTTLEAWGVTPARKKFGEPIMHPDDPAVGKYSLPEGWTVDAKQHAPEWSILDQNDHGRLTVRYDPEDLVFCCLRTPFDMQTKISRGEVPPKDWWEEVYHHGTVVFTSELVHPNTPEVLRARLEIPEHEFFAKIFLPTLNGLLAPQKEAAGRFMTDSFPRFPADPTAYW